MNLYMAYWNRHYNKPNYKHPFFHQRRIDERTHHCRSSPGNISDNENIRFADKTRFDRYQKLTDKARKLYWDKKIKC